MNNLSSSLEDYLECVYNKINISGSVKAIDISKELNVSRASVTEALKKLANKGFINYGRYETIALTDSGRSIAQSIISKHNTLQEFFEKILNLPKEEASDNACKIEHVITDKAFKHISDYVKQQGIK